MSYLVGHSLQCAQGAGQGVYATLAKFKPPAKIAFDFLNQPQEAAYFRSFDEQRLSRQALFLLLKQHLSLAAEAAGWGMQALESTPIFIGSTGYLLSDYELAYLANQSDMGEHSLNQFADDLLQYCGNHQVYCFATSCTSSGHALMQAHAMIEGGLTDRALVLGVESFNLLTLMHFHSLGLLAETCRPFEGDGFVLGEGIACLALSNQMPERHRLRLISSAAATSIHNPVETAAAGLSSVMRQALRQGAAAPEDIVLVKAHAVGSKSSDSAEAEALLEVFGRSMPLAAFKPMIGHTLGASTALETALFYQALQTGRLTAGALPDTEYLLKDGNYLFNFFGFGGNNVSFLWKWQA
ncbi:MAG: beta-ketoacyl synthase N-terminal-like domain-containing protein [Neisseria sp.]|uniref:beta-ketoacyl synthase N-terminal-like domain-containing protein n=1 Tax=Neisseria sp. TaxID=192066 RepID=UPI0026DAA535|nr:beta-ketoacyl synthase N-terminal-like domain-containing protein [Neisseria sp.]MDO4641623.1 beta-ketoacyl synthase N-terminal-like domain-containing protein [Neisseria sp.]